MGCGKTSIGKMLSKRMEYKFFEESFEGCPTLETFYQDPARWSLATEVWFLLKKAKQHQIIGKYSGSTVCDSPIQTGVGVFIPGMYEEGYLTKNEFEMLNSIYYDYIDQVIPKPTQFVYLKCQSDVLVDRIKKRGREFEQGCNEKYLESSIIGIERLIKVKNRLVQPMMVVDGNQSMEDVVGDIVEGFYVKGGMLCQEKY